MPFDDLPVVVDVHHEPLLPQLLQIVPRETVRHGYTSGPVGGSLSTNKTVRRRRA
jgi:hypothetical protein